MKPIQLVCGIAALVVASSCFASCKDVQLYQTVDAQRLWADLSILADDKMEGRKHGTPGNERARAYIADRYNSMNLLSFPGEAYDGYNHSFVVEQLFSDLSGVNVVGWIKGTEVPDSYIVVTAHFDHLGMSGGKTFNGASDNASGVSVMLAIAQHLTEHPPRHSIIFLATDAEEKGLFGAKAFMANPPVDESKIRFNLNLDMLAMGGSTSPKLYVSGANTNSIFKPLVEETIEEAGLCLRNGHRMPRRTWSLRDRIDWRSVSDHAVFIRRDIPYLFVGVTLHEHYNTPDDTVENVDRPFFIAAAETSLKLFQKMDLL